VSAPESWCPEDEDEVWALAETVRFPVAVKFRHDKGMYLSPAERYTKVDEAPALLGVWRRFNELQPRPIIQHYVVGEGYGFEALYDSNGEAVATRRRPIGGLPEREDPGTRAAGTQAPRRPRVARRRDGRVQALF